MLSSILYKQINYSFARKLHKPHLYKYFDRKPDNLYKAKQQLENKLSIPKIPENLFRKVFKQHPKIFVADNRVNERFESRVKLIRELAHKYELAKVMETCIYSNRHILFEMDNEDLERICHAVQNNYGFTKEQISIMFTNYYRTINPKLTEMLDKRIELFHDYLHLSKDQIVQLLAKHPFLIPASALRIRQTILLLLFESKSLGDQILSRDRIIQILNEYPEVFILGRHQIKDLIAIYQDWGLSYQEVWQLILDNPVLLNNYPFEVMPLKKKLFKYFNFTKEMGRLMIKQYPLVLISSVSSLEAKLIFIKDRLKLPVNQSTLELLQYKFSTIRPRGELLVRAKVPTTLENIIGFIKMSDQEFAKRLQIPLERLIEENKRFKDTDEIDWRRRKVLKGSGVEQKVIGILRDMRQELQQQTATA